MRIHAYHPDRDVLGCRFQMPNTQHQGQSHGTAMELCALGWTNLVINNKKTGFFVLWSTVIRTLNFKLEKRLE